MEPRRREAARGRAAPARGRTSRSSTGCARTTTSFARRYDRLYVPRNDGRWLRRNALVAAGNVGGEAERAAVARVSRTDDDELLREHAEWALARIEARDA